jgi:Mce-associated membrane protein
MSYEISSYGIATETRRESDPPGYFRGVRLAPWWRRFAAGLIDYVALPLAAATLANWITPDGSNATVLVFFAVIVIAAFEQGGYSGQSLGKDWLGIRVVYPVLDPDTGPMLKDAGVARCLVRLMLHLVDWFSIFGFFRPLWNPRRQTFADSLTKTIVIADTELELDYLATGPALL